MIGAGLGGLCAAALLASYGKRVTVCESHAVPGGAAHSFRRSGFTFESGPSLFSDLNSTPQSKSDNPMAQVLAAVGEKLPVKRYNSWHVHVPEGSFVTTVGTTQFEDCLRTYVDDTAARQWGGLVESIRPLSAAATAVPAAAARTDGFALFTLARFLPKLLGKDAPGAVPFLLRPFSAFVQQRTGVTHPFLLRWLDLLCFLLSGAPASGTPAAEIAFMFQSWYGKPGSCLEYPLGGSQAIADALVRGLERHGGRLMLNAHVKEILVEGGRACGVRLRNGSVLRAKQAVISNATCWDTVPLLPAEHVPPAWREAVDGTAMCPSFMHLHLGIDARGLDPAALEMHHISLEDWDTGITAPQNLVLVSIGSLGDPSAAPPGCHVIHAYTPATEPWDVWAGVAPGTPEYEALKTERSQVLWRAVEKAIPDVRSRVKVEMTGTPHTHARYLRRVKGTYGGTGWLGGGEIQSPPLPSAETPILGLLCVGDSGFPGAGVPAVAASGMSAAHALVGPLEQCRMLDTVLPA